MKRRSFITNSILGAGAVLVSEQVLSASQRSSQPALPDKYTYDLVIVGGTPGGIMAAIAAVRMNANAKVLLLERTMNIGGLPANGLGATDIGTRNVTGGLFLEFVNRIRGYYVKKYGEKSAQVKDCVGGYHFEPSVAEMILEEMIAETPGITVKRNRQFDSDPKRIEMEGNMVRRIHILNRDTNETELYEGGIFIDATYEGDLAAAAGIPYSLGREGFEVYKEPYAGRIIKIWRGGAAEGTTLQGDNAVQAYNYRLCVTDDPAIRVPIEKPASYNRQEYVSLIGDVKTGRTVDITMLSITKEQELINEKRVADGLPPLIPDMPKKPDGMQRIVNKVSLPNRKHDANNQHLAFISTDLPEENWPWPTSNWDWRDQFAQRLRDYILGLIWFAQHDPELPEWFRKDCLEWGLAKDEYKNNGHFPRQVYVREGRRMKGMYTFTAHDALLIEKDKRLPIHSSSITSSHYAIDSHAVRKREKGKANLDGIFSIPAAPYTVPYGVIVPEKVTNLLMPVPVSASHLGFGTLRMEPCWMALGQAAGVSAVLALRQKKAVQELKPTDIQKDLLKQKVILIYFKEIPVDDAQYPVLQWLALRGGYNTMAVKLDDPMTEDEFDFLQNKLRYKIPGKLKKEKASRRTVFQELANNNRILQ